jgi:hypothetical protein
VGCRLFKDQPGAGTGKTQQGRVPCGDFPAAPQTSADYLQEVLNLNTKNAAIHMDYRDEELEYYEDEEYDLEEDEEEDDEEKVYDYVEEIERYGDVFDIKVSTIDICCSVVLRLKKGEIFELMRELVKRMNKDEAKELIGILLNAVMK